MSKFNLGFALPAHRPQQPTSGTCWAWCSSAGAACCSAAARCVSSSWPAQGNGDSAVTVFGMIVGAALAHNFGLAGNPDSKNEAGQLVVGGISTAGKVAVIVGLVVLLVIAMWNMPKKEATK